MRFELENFLFNQKQNWWWWICEYNCRFFGVFEFFKPVYFIRDLDLIRQLSIKDFESFVNHRVTIDENVDKLFGGALFMLKDQKWRDMRSTLSPAFTGSKMRNMFNLVAEISNNYMTKLNAEIKTEKVIEFKDFANKYCNDVIAKCAFGLTINSLANPDNEFYKMGCHLTRFPFTQQLKFIGFGSVPKLMRVSFTILSLKWWALICFPLAVAENSSVWFENKKFLHRNCPFQHQIPRGKQRQD